MEKETRLYELNEMEQRIESVDSLTMERVKTFKYERNSTLERLVEQVKGRHYSTFSLYKEEKLDGALKIFQENIRQAFQKTGHIEWSENILLILKPK